MDNPADQNPIIPEPNVSAPQPAAASPIPEPVSETPPVAPMVTSPLETSKEPELPKQPEVLPAADTSEPPRPPVLSQSDIIAPPQKPSKGFPKPLILSLSLLLFVTATALGVYFVQKSGLPFNLGEKAAGCPPSSCNGSGYLCSGGCDCNRDVNKGVRWHYKCVEGRVESYTEWDSGCDGSCSGQTEPPPAGKQHCPQGGHQECDNLNKCNIQGGCDPACCATDSDCPSGQVCDIPNGNCDKGKSCNDKGGGHHKECVNNMCVEVGGAGEDKCTSHDACKSAPPPTNGKCPSGKSEGLGGKLNPDPNCASNGGVYCNDGSLAYCCYNQDGDLANGYEYCAEGQQGRCKELSPGSICVANTWSGSVFKIMATDGKCPYSGASQPVNPGGTCDINGTPGRIYSLDAGECGQIDGPCGSCKDDCGSNNPPPSCPNITVSISPNNPKPGDTITFDVYSPKALACTQITSVTGISGNLTNSRIEGKYHWKWDAIAGAPGNYSIKFKGNTEDSGSGNCPQRAVGSWCEASANFTINPPGKEPCCSNVTLTKIDAEGQPLEGTDFKIGDRVKITVAVEGTVEDVLVRIKRGGVKLTDLKANGQNTGDWQTVFQIPADGAGEYEVLSFVKVDGVWK
jgi:hypothetical protein